MDIKGIAHINLTVSDFERSLPFYEKLFALIGMRQMIRTDSYYYCVGKRVAIGIQSASAENSGKPFDQGRAGLHHFCLSMHSREDVDVLAAFAADEGMVIVREPASQDHWFQGMYSFLFEDPDGIRIEANHIAKAD